MAMSYLQQAQKCGGFCTITCQCPMIMASNSRCRTDHVRYSPHTWSWSSKIYQIDPALSSKYFLNSPLRCRRLHSELEPKAALLSTWRACCFVKYFFFLGLSHTKPAINRIMLPMPAGRIHDVWKRKPRRIITFCSPVREIENIYLSY